MNIYGLLATLLVLFAFQDGCGTFHEALTNMLIDTSCTLILFQINPQFIKDLVTEMETHMSDDQGKIFTLLTISDIDFDITSLNKHTGCLIALSNINRDVELQKLMFPSYRRQLILVNTNSTNQAFDIKVSKFHHPISILSNDNDRIIHNLACRNGHIEMANYYGIDRKSWSTLPDIDTLNKERKCNNGHHPLQGMFMKGSGYGAEPFVQYDPETLEIIGGVTFDIFDTLAKHFQIEYTIKYSNNWYIFNPDGTIEGSLGDVIMGDYDFSLEQALNIGIGQGTIFTYYTFTNFFELKPEKLSAIYNIGYTFDRYIWVLTWVSVLIISCTMYLMYRREPKNSKKTFSQVFWMCYGNMFQEYGNMRWITTGRKSTKFHMIWIIATTFLSMAFVGNLKSALVRNNYKSRTLTISEMLDNDVLLFTPNTLDQFLEMDYTMCTNNVINKKVLRQGRKTKDALQIPGDYFKQLDHLLEHGGAACFILRGVLALQKKYHEQHKDFPIIMIPETYLTWPLAFIFKDYDFRVEYLNPVISNIRDMGIIEHYFSKWESPKNMREHVEYVEEPLRMSHFFMSLMLWSAGLGLSLILFKREVWSAKGREKGNTNQSMTLHVKRSNHSNNVNKSS